MKWVIAHLKKVLRREKMFGTKHGSMKGDKKYAVSATFSEQRIPQLMQAIEILESMEDKPVQKKASIQKAVSNQLTINY